MVVWYEPMTTGAPNPKYLMLRNVYARQVLGAFSWEHIIVSIIKIGIHLR